MRPLLLALLCLSLTACGTVAKPERIVVTQREAVLPPADMRTRCTPMPAATIGELLEQQDDRIMCLLDQIDRQQKWYDDIMNNTGGMT